MTMFYGDDDDETGKYRFKFEMRGENELIIIGINPSTARADPKGTTTPDTDNTINRAIKFNACNWNYGNINFDGFLMLNLYAQSASTPNALHSIIDHSLHQKNIGKIDSYLQALKSAGKEIYVLLAYGDGIEKRKYLRCCLHDIVTIMQTYNARFFRMQDLRKKTGKTEGLLSIKGNPFHILFLPANSPLVEINDADNDADLVAILK